MVTIEELPNLIIGILILYLIIKIYEDLKKRFDWGGEEKLKEEQKKYDESIQYSDDVYTVKLFCDFMMETYLEFIDKIKKEDYDLSDKFVEDFKSKYDYYIKVKNVDSLVDKWDLTLYGNQQKGFDHLEIYSIEEILEETKVDEIDYGYSLDWTYEEEYLDGYKDLSKLRNNLDNKIEEIQNEKK